MVYTGYIQYIPCIFHVQYLIHCFLKICHFFIEILRTFSGIFLCVLRSEYSFSDGGTFLSKKKFLLFSKKSEFRRRRTAWRPQDCAWHFDTKFSRNQNFDSYRRGLGPAVLCQAGPSQNGRIFLENRKKQGSEPAGVLQARWARPCHPDVT